MTLNAGAGTGVTDYFECCECGLSMIAIGAPPREPPLCGACRFVPRWFEDPHLRELLDRYHTRHGTKPAASGGHG